MTTTILFALAGLVAFLTVTLAFAARRAAVLAEYLATTAQAERERWIEAFMSRHAGELATFDRIDAQKAAFEHQIAQTMTARNVDREWERYEDTTRYESVGGA